MKNNYDVVILGAGITGLCIAYMLSERTSYSIAILEKESDIGLHTSGRNSGVLHAGIYYKPNTLKAELCIEGKKLLESWIIDNGGQINRCGKIVVPQTEDDLSTLDKIIEYSKANSVKFQLISSNEAKNICSLINIPMKKALYVPETAVFTPKEVLRIILEKLKERNVHFLPNTFFQEINPNESLIKLKESLIKYGYLFNCAGAHSLSIAKYFFTDLDYQIIPFRGNYLDISKSLSKEIKTNIYPVPVDKQNFLGVHFTPPSNESETATIGPTANLALGRENYFRFDNVEPIITTQSILSIANMALQNSNSMRNYIRSQMLPSTLDDLYKKAKKLIPVLKKSDVKYSSKCGIRPQLYSKSKNCLEDDFIIKNTENTTHILNAISPAFTSSFAFAKYTIMNSNINIK